MVVEVHGGVGDVTNTSDGDRRIGDVDGLADRLDGDALVEALLRERAAAETRDVLRGRGEGVPERRVERAGEDGVLPGVGLVGERGLGVAEADGLGDELEDVAEGLVHVTAAEVVETPVGLDGGDGRVVGVQGVVAVMGTSAMCLLGYGQAVLTWYREGKWGRPIQGGG